MRGVQQQRGVWRDAAGKDLASAYCFSLCSEKRRALRHGKFSLLPADLCPFCCSWLVAVCACVCVRVRPTRVPEPTLGSLSRHSADDDVVARRGLSCGQILYFNAEARKYDPGEHVLF